MAWPRHWLGRPVGNKQGARLAQGEGRLEIKNNPDEKARL